MSGPQEATGLVEGKADLVAYLAAGSKPKSDWRIGTEHEKFGFCRDTLNPLPYDGERSVRAMLAGLAQFGWLPVHEDDKLIALKDRAGASVTLEPGGQFELSGAPLETLHETCREVNTHLTQVREVSEKIGVGFLGLGFAPTWTLDQIPTMPKGRYGIMRRYMPTVGQHGLDMMYRTCTVQVNLDFGDEADMVRKMRVAIALQPVATALFSNSPFTEGRPNGFQSYRSEIWRDTDRARAGMVPFVFEDGFGFERYVDFVLDVPMYFVFRDGRYIDASGQSFRDFLDGRLPALPGERPTMADWADHLTTVFPEARLKRFIEMRGADGGPWRSLCALPALWAGLLYDDAALAAAWDVCKRWDAETRQAWRDAVPRGGLKAEVGGRTMQSIAREVVEIAHDGLAARQRLSPSGDDETLFLDPLREIVRSGRTAADVLLDRYNGDWRGDIRRVFAEYAY